MISYRRLTEINAKANSEIRGLVSELSPDSAETYSRAVLARAARDKNTYILVARERGTIVGMGTLITMLTPSGAYGMVEDVVITASMRGKGVGRGLVERLVAHARRQKLPLLELTSNPTRIAANRLYPSLGFKKRETNVYRLVL